MYSVNNCLPFFQSNYSPTHTSRPLSYKILNPKGVDQVKDPKKIAECILDAVHLDAELYRLGNTKA